LDETKLEMATSNYNYNPILAFYTIIPVLNNEAPQFIKAYSDTTVFEKAIAIANANSKSKSTFGTIKAIDKLTILEGTTVYSNNDTSITSTIRIKGNHNQGKMDFIANKKGKRNGFLQKN